MLTAERQWVLCLTRQEWRNLVTLGWLRIAVQRICRVRGEDDPAALRVFLAMPNVNLEVSGDPNLYGQHIDRFGQLGQPEPVIASVKDVKNDQGDTIAEFEKANPDLKVKAVYAGNYDDTRVKALAAVKANQPVQLSVLFSIDVFELIDQDVIVPFDDFATTAEDKQWLASFYSRPAGELQGQRKDLGHPFPALHHRPVPQQGYLQGSRP